MKVPRGERWATTTAGLVVAAAMVVGATACSSDDDDTDRDRDDPGDDAQVGPELLVLDSPGTGLEPAPAYDLGEQQGFELSMELFGDPGADDWFAGGDLSIWTSPQPEALSATEAPEGTTDPRERITIRRGTQAFLQEGSRAADASAAAASNALAWSERPDLGVAVVSASLSTGELTAAAETVEIGAGGSVTLAEPPAGLEPVASITGTQVASPLWYVWLPDGTSGLALRYLPVDPGPGSVDLVSFDLDDPADADDLLAYLRYRRLDTAPTPVDIGDREVWLSETSDLAMAFWTESPSTAVLLSVESPPEGTSVEDLIADVRPATSDERDELVVEPDDPATPATPTETTTTTTP